MEKKTAPVLLGIGKYWEELAVGNRFRTLSRTITESDLVNFISSTGMLEVIFTDATYQGAMGGRAVPGTLTCGIIEGLQMQTLLQGTGLAMLEMTVKAVKPVYVGNTIYGIVEITTVRETSKGGRAVVSSAMGIYNQDDELVMNYSATRLIAGRAN